MPNKGRLSTRALTNRLYEFLIANRPFLAELKITTEAIEGISVTMLRCILFERFLNLLEEHMFVAKWSNQHDAFKIFLNVTLLQGDLSQVERRNAHNVLIDIIHATDTIELKTKQAISLTDTSTYLGEYFPEMVAHQGEKSHWWLVFFVQRGEDPQSKLGETCSYYLVLVEIRTRGLVATADCLLNLSEEVMTLVQKVEKRVREEDQVKKGIFAPVDNYVVVERLRKRVKKVTRERDKALREKEAALQEKDALIKKLQEEMQKR